MTSAKFTDYAQETTIHGVSELIRYKSWAFRITWLLTMSIMLGALVKELYDSGTKYLAKPRATRIDNLKSRVFPPVAMCTTDWIDQERAETAGLKTVQDQMLALGGLCFSIPRPNNFINSRAPFGQIVKMVKENDWSTFDYEAAVEKAGSIENLYQNIGFEFEEIGNVSCAACKQEIKVRKFVRDVGVCWLFEPGPIKEPTNRVLRIPTLEISVNFPVHGTMNENSTFTIFAGSHADSVLGAEHASVVPFSTNIVDVTLMRKTKTRDCNATRGHSTGVCDIMGYAFIADHCDWGCMPYPGNMSAMGMMHAQPYCNWVLQSDLFEGQCVEQLPELPMNCLEPCNQTLVQAATSQLPVVYDNNHMRVNVRLVNIFEMMVYAEYDAYPLEALLPVVYDNNHMRVNVRLVNIFEMMVYAEYDAYPLEALLPVVYDNNHMRVNVRLVNIFEMMVYAEYDAYPLEALLPVVYDNNHMRVNVRLVNIFEMMVYAEYDAYPLEALLPVVYDNNHMRVNVRLVNIFEMMVYAEYDAYPLEALLPVVYDNNHMRVNVRLVNIFEMMVYAEYDAYPLEALLPVVYDNNHMRVNVRLVNIFEMMVYAEYDAYPLEALLPVVYDNNHMRVNVRLVNIFEMMVYAEYDAYPLEALLPVVYDNNHMRVNVRLVNIFEMMVYAEYDAYPLEALLPVVYDNNHMRVNVRLVNIFEMMVYAEYDAYPLEALLPVVYDNNHMRVNVRLVNIFEMMVYAEYDAYPLEALLPVVYDNNHMRVNVRLVNIFEMMVYAEYDAYPLEALVSDLGGLLGLFLGASAISLAHTIYFCCILPLTGIRRVDSECQEEEDKKKKGEKSSVEEDA